MNTGHANTNSDSSESLRMARTYLGDTVELAIDRPHGSHHPVHGFRYDTNYGHVPGTTAPDGDALDGYYLGENQPLDTARGTCIAIVHRLDDDDDKLVVVPPGRRFSDDEITAAVKFQEIRGRYRIIRP